MTISQIYKQLVQIQNKKLLLAILIFFTIFSYTIILPNLTFAARRNHRFHSISTKLTPTPTPTSMTTAAINSNDLMHGQWDFMPGASQTDAGISIYQTDLSIVSQDGSESISNAPINLAGTYLKDITGDLSITAKMLIPKNTTATMQLYGNPPIIADEFRIERSSMQLAITDGQLVVKVWNGTNQNVSSMQSYSIPMDGTLELTITRQKDVSQIIVNNIIIGTVKTPTLFTSGNIWFGFDSKDGDWLLSGLQAQAVPGGTVHVGDGSILSITNHNPQGLQLLALKKRPGFLVGMALALGPSVSDSEYAAIAFDKSMLGSITPENDMKMINLQPQPGIYTFQKADSLINLANQNGITDIHGHALVFAEANPLWFNALPVKTTADKLNIEKIMIDHITTVVKHFGDKVKSWDVVNEPIADYDYFDQSSGKILREHKWYQAMGSAYIIKAFDAAYAANPHALLSINEYGLEADGERWDAFVNLMKQFAVDLKTHNIPLANISIGFQAHVYEKGDLIDPVILRNHIRTLAGMGLKTQISEMDVYNDDGDAIQAKQYADVFNACISEENCIAWRGWILSDRYDVFKDDNGKIQYGIDGLFSTTMQPRPGFTAIQKILTSLTP